MVLMLFLLRFIGVLVFHQVLYGLIPFKKKQQLSQVMNTWDFISSQYMNINSKIHELH